MAKYVRIKPYNKKRGNLVRRYITEGQKFDIDKGWYLVQDERFAARLAKLTQDGTDETPLIFDVCTKEEAMRIDAAEAKKADRANAEEAESRSANRASSRVVTTNDAVARRRAERVEKEEEDEEPELIDGADGDPELDLEDGGDKGTAVGKIDDGEKKPARRRAKAS